MTRKEREALRKAVQLLWDQEWEAGMEILLPLAGLRSPALKAIATAEAVGLKDILSRDPVIIALVPLKETP